MDRSPMIVHCSAGVGRSGATIAIDTILNRIRTDGLDTEIDIANIVKHIRTQRSGKYFDIMKINIVTFFFLRSCANWTTI